MKLGFRHLLLFSAVLPAVGAAHTKDRIQKRQNSDKEVIASFSESGFCFDYVKDGPRDKSLEPCKTWCEENEDSKSYGCEALMTDDEIEDLPGADIKEDDDGNQWVPGKCSCNFEIIEEIVDVVAEGLGKLDEIICATFTSAFMSIADIGSNFIPGAGQAKAVGRAVEGAKTFAENGMDGGSMFTSWIGPACGLDDWEFDINKVFMGLTQMPDSLGTSQGCKKKSKKKCKEPEPRPDPPKSKKKDDPESTTTKTDEPTSTKTDEPTSTKTDEPTGTCKLNKRDSNNKCLDDSCKDIEPWPKDIMDLSKEDGSDDDSEEVPKERSIRGTGFFGLEERAAKRKTGVKGVKICSEEYLTDLFPSSGKLLGVKGRDGKEKPAMDDSIFALKDPASCGDFDFGRRSNDLYEKVYKQSPSQNLRFVSEHVLEAQAIGDFFQTLDQSLGDEFPDPFDTDDEAKVGFCTYIEAFWSRETNVPWPEMDNENKPAGKWLADQFPTDKNWRDEFFLVPGGVNGLKEKAWGMDNKVVIANDKMSALTKKDYDFLDDKKIKDSEFEKALIRFKDMMSLNTYQSDSAAQDVLKKQAKRIEDMLEKLEKELENMDFKKRNKKFQRRYERRDLAQKWKEFIKEHVGNAQKKIDSWFDKYADEYTKAKKDMEKKVKDLKGKKGKKEEDDRKKFEDVIAYIETAEKKHKEMKSWKNPF